MVGLVVAISAIWHFRMVTGPMSSFGLVAADLFHYFLPSYAYEAARLRAGAVPFWNPYQAAGQPFLASLQPGVLYPARLLLLLFDVPTAMRWSTMGHIVLTALATFACCRAVGASRAGAALGGGIMVIVFSFTNVFSPSYMEAGTWIPVAAFAFMRVVAGGGLGWAALLGVAAAMPALAGGYQLTMYFPYGLAAFALAVAVDARWRGAFWTPRTLGLVAVAGVLALATAAPQLATTLAWTTETQRPAAPLTDPQIAPVLKLPSQWIRDTFVPGNSWQSSYLSVPGVVLALVGFASSGALGAILGVGALFFYGLSLGPGTPIFPLYRYIPGFALFRLPQRLMTLVVFLAAVGAALGVTALARVRVPGLGPRRSRVLLEIAALGVVGAALVVPLRNGELLPWSALPSRMEGPPGLFPALARLNGDGRTVLPRGYMVGLTTKQGMMQGVRTLEDYEPLSSRRLGRYLNAIAGLPPPREVDFPPFVGRSPSPAIVRPELLELAAVRTVVRFSNEPELVAPPLVRTDDVAGFHVYASPGASSRASLVGRVRFVETEADAMTALTAPGFDGRTEAVLVGAPDAEAVAAPDRAGEERARIVVDEPEHVVVDLAIGGPRLMVLADAFAPGWTAVVDGAPRRIWQANCLFRGVYVRPGDRRVEFRYRAPGFREGMTAAAVAWGLVALVGAAQVARRRRAGSAP
jgi:hypothetical protein